MKRIGAMLGVAIWFSAAGLQAQDVAPTPFADEPAVPYESPTVPHDSPSSHISWGQLQPTAQMWLYEQEKADHLDTRLAVRRKAERKTAERQSRIASMKWYGMSNSRPYANPTPLCGMYSPGWHANSYNGNQWTYGRSPLVLTRASGLQFSSAYGIW